MLDDFDPKDSEAEQGAKTGNFDIRCARMAVGVLITPAFLISCSGKVLGHNKGGKDLLGASVFLGMSGVLKFFDNVLDNKFADLRRRFFESSEHNIRELISPKFAVRLRRCPDAEGYPVMDHALVTLRRSCHDWGLSPEAMERTLSLPPMQARLVHAMLNGKNLEGFAKDADVTKSAAKWHLSAVMPKFECRLWRDSLGENSAAIRMRCGSRTRT